MSNYHDRFGSPAKRKKKRRQRIIVFVSIILFLSVIASLSFFVKETVFDPNVWTPDGEDAVVFIPTSADFNDVKAILFKQGVVIHRGSFERVSRWLKYDTHVKPGRYLLSPKMNNLELVRLLRSGAQKPVMVTFNNMRDIYQLAGRIAAQLETDSMSLVNALSDSGYLSFLGYNNKTIPSMFIPNTYEFYWTTNASGFISRMFDENKKFWNTERSEKAAKLGLSKVEVSTLASIIDKETNKDSEKPTMAGVYINRLKSGWRLQADPTLVFAVGDFEIRRVLDIHKTVESPYNTYLYPGLPPGPICIPSIASIDAVLNYKQHNYYFFCASDDLSGYHLFASSYAEHEANAWRYRKALDKLNIK